MALTVFKTVYLLLVLLAIPQVLAGPHLKKRCSKCKNCSKSSSGNGPSSTLSSLSTRTCGSGGTPTLSPSPTTSPSPSSSPPPSSPSPSPSPSPNTDLSTGNSDEDEFLRVHNEARAKYDASPVQWGDYLEQYAKNWGDQCMFKHSGGKYGENLYAATGSTDIINDAMNAWMAEVKDYNPNNPVASHFTQVVWKDTTTIGCSVSQCDAGTIFDVQAGASQFVVCSYDPPGNYDGEYSGNVEIPPA